MNSGYTDSRRVGLHKVTSFARRYRLRRDQEFNYRGSHRFNAFDLRLRPRGCGKIWVVSLKTFSKRSLIVWRIEEMVPWSYRMGKWPYGRLPLRSRKQSIWNGVTWI